MTETPAPYGRQSGSNETVTYEEILMSNVYAQEAIINLLERKGLLTRKEVLQEIVKIKKNSG